MKIKNWMACVVVVGCAFVDTGAVVARDDAPTDGGKGSAFKSKTYEMKENGEVAVLLTFVAGKEVTATTDGDKQTDVHLFVHEGAKEIGKDTSPGPKCALKFTPKKDGTFKLTVKNNGPGANKVTLDVKVAE